MTKSKQHHSGIYLRAHPMIPTQQDFEYDRFYYNSEEDTREVLSEVLLHDGRKALKDFMYTENSSYSESKDDEVGFNKVSW